MPRTARLKGENQIYHITQRGNNKEKVFETDQDKRIILSNIFNARIKHQISIFAYCIMDNHYHILINDNGNDISKIFKEINYAYARYFNWVYGRTGHVFQERFFSEIIDTESYLYAAINYIHDNPIRAGITQNRYDYKWSSSL